MEKIIDILFIVGIFVNLMKGAEILIPKKLQENINKKTMELRANIYDKNFFGGMLDYDDHINKIKILSAAIGPVFVWGLINLIASLKIDHFEWFHSFEFYQITLWSIYLILFSLAIALLDEKRVDCDRILIFLSILIYEVSEIFLIKYYLFHGLSIHETIQLIFSSPENILQIILLLILAPYILMVLLTPMLLLGLGIIILTILLPVGTLIWLLNRVSEYDKGPFAAFVLLITIGLGILKLYLS